MKLSAVWRFIYPDIKINGRKSLLQTSQALYKEPSKTLFYIGKPGRFQGVNSGVVLFDLEKMRGSKLYNKYTEDEGVEDLVRTYNMSLRRVLKL
jgi:hypothetical protein